MSVRGRAILALVSASVLASCKNTLPPAQPVPPAPTATGYALEPPAPLATANDVAGGAQSFVLGLDVAGQWWTLFHSERLSALVSEAIASNPDVAAAQAALRASRETYYAQRASAYPSAQGALSVTRQQDPLFYSPPLNNPPTAYVYGIHTLQLNVAYVPDVFGNLRFQTLATKNAAEIARFQTEATYLTLTANVAIAAFSIAELRDELAMSERMVDTDRAIVALTRTRQDLAQSAGLDVLAQEATLRSAEQTIPPLQKQLAESIDALARLVGRSPNDPPIANFSLADLHLPERLPLSLPSKLVEQRPDIAAASANLAQASDFVHVAYTNRLPNFSIDALTATQALSAGGLFGLGSLLSTLTAQVTQTFYDHGTLVHRQAAAVADYDQAAAQYRGAVLSGLQNVADSMASLEYDARALQTTVASAETARRELKITQSQQKLGAVSSLAVLTADQNDEQAELAIVATRANRYMDTAALFQALGGGWWNRNETAPTK